MFFFFVASLPTFLFHRAFPRVLIRLTIVHSHRPDMLYRDFHEKQAPELLGPEFASSLPVRSVPRGAPRWIAQVEHDVAGGVIVAQVRPVLPNPPTPRAVCDSSVTSTTSGVSTGTMMSWAMRSNFSTLGLARESNSNVVFAKTWPR